MTREQAIDLARSGALDKLDDLDLFWFQVNEPLLCCDFGRFHKATETALGRPVFTHEFADPDSLRAEFLRERKAPTFDEILKRIPADKALLIVLDHAGRQTGEGA